MKTNKEVIELTDKLKSLLSSRIQQKNKLDSEMNEIILTILESKGLDYDGKKIYLNDSLNVVIEEDSPKSV